MGRNNADFNGINITHEFHDYYEQSNVWRVVATHPEYGELGHLIYGSDNETPDTSGPHTVLYLSVKPEHRRKGVATALWNYAKQVQPNLKHNYGSLTESGEAWQKTLGD